MRSSNMRGGLSLAVAATLALASVGAVTAQDEPIEVAYLSASSANTWLQASVDEMERIAAENNIVITEFDGQFDAGLQTTQLLDAIAADRYDGMIVAAIDGASLIPDLETAAEQGIKIVGLNQVIGDDLGTADPQTPAISASVMEPPLQRGQRLGQLTIQACEGLEQCDVVYFFGIPGIPLDIAIRQGFDEVTAGSNVNIVNEGESGYLGPDLGLDQMQDILTSTPDFDVVVGADQGMQGAEIALTDAGVLGDVRVIGFGGGAAALAAVKDGRWWGVLNGTPATEGRLAIEALIAALDGEDLGGIDPALTAIDAGLVTAENVDQFTPEWEG